jgi:hypothetical protein
MDQGLKERLDAINWFGQVGSPAEMDLPFQIVQTQDWQQALTQGPLEAWQDVQLAASNRLTGFLHGNYRDRYRAWNEVARDAKAGAVSALAGSKWAHFAESMGLPRGLIDSASWDILFAIMESEYGDCQGRPSFFLHLLSVYEAGKFPCGWDGRWPMGSLIVW